MNFITDLIIYPNAVMFSFAETDKALRSALKPHLCNADLKTGDWKLVSGEVGKYVIYDNGFLLIRLPSIPITPSDFSCLQHEIFHSVVAVMEHIGTTLSDANNENYAYLIDYLTKESYTKIFEYKSLKTENQSQ